MILFSICVNIDKSKRCSRALSKYALYVYFIPWLFANATKIKTNLTRPGFISNKGATFGKVRHWCRLHWKRVWDTRELGAKLVWPRLAGSDTSIAMQTCLVHHPSYSVLRVFLDLYCLALPESHRFFGILLTLDDMMYFISAKLSVKGMGGPVLEGAPYLSSLHSQPLLKFWSRLEPTSQLLNFSLLGIFLSIPVESLNVSSLELLLQSCSIFFSEKYRRQPCQQ